MKEDKLQKFREFMTVLTVILLISSIGIYTFTYMTKTAYVKYFDNILVVRTMSQNVSELLQENNIYVNDDMTISVDLNAKVENDMQIVIDESSEYLKLDTDTIETHLASTATKIVSEEEVLKFGETQIDNNLIARGVTKITEEGLDGLATNQYFVKSSVSDEEIYKVKVDTTVIKEPINKVIEVGTNLALSVNRNANIIIPKVDSNFKEYNINLSLEEQQYAYHLSQKYGFDYELFLAVMFKESSYRASAVGGGNSYGLCQIHESNFTYLQKTLGISNFLDPYENMEAGAYMLNLYLNSARKISSDPAFIEVYGLNSYNMGEGAYYSLCYSQGILHRDYSTSIRALRDKIKATGTV